MRLAAQAKGGYYPTPERVVAMIASLVGTPFIPRRRAPETLRILDPCCGGGDAAALLADALRARGLATVESYGVELHRDRAEEARNFLDHVLAADLFQTSIANNAFGLLLLNPPYDHDAEEKRTEHAFLLHSTRYLAPGGLLIYIVPRRRLAVSARHLASHYGMLRRWAFPDPERDAFDQVVVMGYRRAEPTADATAIRQTAAWLQEEDDLPPLPDERYPIFTTATAPAGPVLFAIRTADPVAAAEEARRSGLWTSAEISQSLWPVLDRRARPLMPLRRGHMAMLVAAGFLDNLVLESHGRRALVKGRAAKELILAEETPEKEVYRERLRTTVVAIDLDSGAIEDIAA